MKLGFLKLFVILFIFFLLPKASLAQEFEIKHADSLEADPNEIFIKGNILVNYKGAVINAEEGKIETNNKGKPNKATFFKRAKIKLKDRKIEADNLTILIEDKVIYAEGNTLSELNDKENKSLIITADYQELLWSGEDAKARGNIKAKHEDTKVTSDEVKIIYKNKKPIQAIFFGASQDSSLEQPTNTTYAKELIFDINTSNVKAIGNVKSKIWPDEKKSKSEQDAVTINAEELLIDNDSGVVTAKSNSNSEKVKLTYQETKGESIKGILLRGNKNKKPEKIIFKGKANVSQPDKELSSEEVIFNFKDKKLTSNAKENVRPKTLIFKNKWSIIWYMKDILNIKFLREYIRNFFSNLSFQAKLIISMVFGISIFITVCAFLIIEDIQDNIDREVLSLNHNLKTVQILTQLAGQALVLDYKSNQARKQKLTDLTNSFLKEYPAVAYVVLTDNAGNILCKSRFADIYGTTSENPKKITPPKHVPFIKMSYSKSGKLLTISEPIQFNSNFFGWAWIGIPDSGFTIVGSRKELVVFLLEIFLLVWVLSVIGAIINSIIITRPLRKLEKSAKAITEGRFGFQLPLKGFLGKELSQLVKAFNKMSKRLQQYEESNIATLYSERNKFESVVMSIADGVIVFNKENTIQIVNLAARKLLNNSGSELVGQKVTNIWNEKIKEKVCSYLDNIKDGSTADINSHTDFDIVVENRNLKFFITPLYDSNNEKVGAVMVIHDRTKETEIELLKQEFISNVSHELRTPITSIKCYVDTLCAHKTQIDEKTKTEFLGIVNEETDRLSNLVNDVLELSRLESPHSKLLLKLDDLYPCLEYALKSIVVLAEKKSIKLIKDIEENLPLININQENLERILINLLSNAIKYTPGNGLVKLIVRKDENDVVFKVIDNGIGIQEEHIPLIFERFYRVENKVHTIKGTGLGLTIVKKSIEQHGGKISVRSKLGEGSIFEFSLPIPTETYNIKDFKKESHIARTA